MKSSREDLRKRGMIEPSDIDFMKNLKDEELLKLINSKIAVERSASVRLLLDRGFITDENFVKLLLERLNLEKSIYTKLEICNALENGNEKTAELMIYYLGAMGNNQHKTLPKDVSKKVSYPLPRDIIARVLGKMKPSVMPVLVTTLNSKDEKQLSELIDAFGFLVFYNQELSNMENLTQIIHLLNKYSKNEIIFWKCTQCLSAFPLEDSFNILNEILKSNQNELIKNEAKRSLKLIKK